AWMFYYLRQVDRTARAGRWPEASRFAAVAAARGDLEPNGAAPIAYAGLQAGDSGTYRRVCAAVARALRDHPTPPLGEVNALAWILAIGPGGLDRYDAPIGRLEAGLRRIPATEGRTRHNSLNTLGGLLCRAGHWDEAVARLSEGLAGDPGG